MSSKQLTIFAELGLLLATIIWGSAFVIVKNATDTIPPSYIIAFRFGIATILMCIVFFPRLKEIDRGCIKSGIILGFLFYVPYYLQTLGVKYTTAGNNAFLTAVYVVVVPFFYWFIKNQKPDRFNLIAAFLCMTGIGLLSLTSNFTMNFGDVLSLLCGVGFSAQIVATAIFTQKNDPILLSVTQFTATAIIAIVVSLFSEPFPAHMGIASITGVFYLGIFSTMIALLIQTVSQKYIPASKASLIMALEAVFGCVFGTIFLHEKLTPRILSGFAFIFAAILISEIKPSFLNFKIHKTEPVMIPIKNDKYKE